MGEELRELERAVDFIGTINRDVDRLFFGCCRRRCDVVQFKQRQTQFAGQVRRSSRCGHTAQPCELSRSECPYGIRRGVSSPKPNGHSWFQKCDRGFRSGTTGDGSGGRIRSRHSCGRLDLRHAGQDSAVRLGS